MEVREGRKQEERIGEGVKGGDRRGGQMWREEIRGNKMENNGTRTGVKWIRKRQSRPEERQ